MLIGIDASRANVTQRTGTEWYSYYLIEQLKQIDQENSYLLYSKEKLFDGLEILPPHFKSKVLKWPFRKLWTQGRFSLEMLFHAPDILFVPAHVIPPIHPKKTVTTCHDVGFERFPELYSQKELSYHRWAMRQATIRALRIITVSQFTRREMMEVYNIDPERIDVIYNSYDEEHYKVIDDQQAISERLKKYHLKQPFFLYVGRLEQKKNTPFLVEAFSLALSQISQRPHLVLAGVPGYGYDRVRQMMDHHDPGREFIHEIGYAAEEDLPYLLNAAQGFIFPSLYEGFGIPVLQAMACGLPVLSSSAGSLPEVGLHSALFFDPKNKDEFVSVLSEFLENEGLRRDLRAKGLERVKQFSWRRCAEETLRVIKKASRMQNL